jgi:hypothetical protein
MSDTTEPGVFIKARKPYDWKPIDLNNISLYSIILGKRTKKAVSLNDMPLIRKLMIRFCNSKFTYILPKIIDAIIRRNCI